VASVRPGYIRPTGGIVVGPDGMLYSGWMAKYGTYGGAIAITDPASGETTLIENPLGEQAISGLAVDAKHAYVGTTLSANGLPSKPNASACFGMVELASRKIVFKHTFEGVSNVGRIGYDARTKLVVMAAGPTLRTFDPRRKELIPICEKWPTVSSTMALPGNGKVYTADVKALVCIDLSSQEAEQLAELPARVRSVTIDPDGAVYVACGEDVYRVKPDGEDKPAGH
jgi:hypothetical protein